jgi:hypothetical protein
VRSWTTHSIISAKNRHSNPLLAVTSVPPLLSCVLSQLP